MISLLTATMHDVACMKGSNLCIVSAEFMCDPTAHQRHNLEDKNTAQHLQWHESLQHTQQEPYK